MAIPPNTQTVLNNTGSTPGLGLPANPNGLLTAISPQNTQTLGVASIVPDNTLTFYTGDDNGPVLKITEDGKFTDRDGNEYQGLEEVHSILCCILSNASQNASQNVMSIASDKMEDSILSMVLKRAYDIPYEDIPKHLSENDEALVKILRYRLGDGL